MNKEKQNEPFQKQIVEYRIEFDVNRKDYNAVEVIGKSIEYNMPRVQTTHRGMPNRFYENESANRQQTTSRYESFRDNYRNIDNNCKC